ncbi:MAG TPA: TonB-dependent receptor [Bryobacteraceae bacterium]|nr:TonB-dependent receptor [Bryobacteraceae bacterium]
MTGIPLFRPKPRIWAGLLLVVAPLLIATGTEIDCWASQAPQDPQGATPLRLLSLEELGNIEVTTVSKEPEEVWRTPAAIYVLTKQDIRRSGATSIPEALRLVPGVEVERTDANTWAVGIRGFGSQFSKSVLVLIDGRNVYTPLFAGVNWRLQNVMIEDVARIEVIRGPGGTIWGTNAVNGVINIITENSENTRGALVSAGGGSVEQGNVAMRYGGTFGRNFSYRFYGMAFRYGPELHPDDNNFDEWDQGQGGFRLDWDNHKKDALSIQGDLYKGSIGESENITYYSPPGSVLVNTPEDVSGGNLLFKWQRKANEKSDFLFQAYYDRTYRIGSQLGEKRNTFDLDFIHHLRTLPRQEITWGLGARWSPSDFIQTVPSVIFQPYHQADNIYSAFVQDKIAIVQDSLWITLGSKFEHNIYTGWETQPDARVLWTPTLRQSVWAAVTRAVRSPSRLDEDLQLTSLYATNPEPVFLAVAGNSQFVSEKLLGYEFGYRRLVTPRMYFDIALFHNNYNDLTSYGSPVIAPETFSTPAGLVAVIPWTNGIRGTTEGFEIAPDWKPKSWLEVKGSWSYLNMDLKSKAGDSAATTIQADEGSSPRHKVVLQARINLPKGFEFDPVYRYVSALPAQYSAGLPADYVKAYNTVDVRVARQINHALELSISGQNLLQPGHAEFAGDPGPLVLIKRTVYAALTWRERDTP